MQLLSRPALFVGILSILGTPAFGAFQIFMPKVILKAVHNNTPWTLTLKDRSTGQTATLIPEHSAQVAFPIKNSKDISSRYYSEQAALLADTSQFILEKADSEAEEYYVHFCTVRKLLRNHALGRPGALMSILYVSGQPSLQPTEWNSFCSTIILDEGLSGLTKSTPCTTIEVELSFVPSSGGIKGLQVYHTAQIKK